MISTNRNLYSLLPHQIIRNLVVGVGIIGVVDGGGGFAGHDHHVGVAFGDFVADDAGDEVDGFALTDNHQPPGDEIVLNGSRDVYALDFVVVGEVIGDVAIAFALAALLHIWTV